MHFNPKYLNQHNDQLTVVLDDHPTLVEFLQTHLDMLLVPASDINASVTINDTNIQFTQVEHVNTIPMQASTIGDMSEQLLILDTIKQFKEDKSSILDQDFMIIRSITFTETTPNTFSSKILYGEVIPSVPSLL